MDNYQQSNSFLRDLHQSRQKKETIKSFEINDQEIKIKEDVGEALGSRVWSGSQYLCKYICENFKREDFEGKTVCELGSGCGLPGIVAATLGANVVVCDLPELVALLQENVNLNNVQDNVQVLPLAWGEGVDHLPNRPYDYIIAADVIYKEELFDPLIDTILKLCGNWTKLIISYQTRIDHVEIEFFRKIKENFNHPQLTKYFLKEEQKQDSGLGRDITIFDMNIKNTTIGRECKGPPFSTMILGVDQFIKLEKEEKEKEKVNDRTQSVLLKS